MGKKYKIMLISITLLLVCSIFMGTSYSIWTTSYTQVGTNEINVGCFNVTYTNLSSYGGNEAGDINLVNAYPITDASGSALTPYMFTIKNECSVAASYKINLETLNTSTFNTDYLKVKFNEGSSTSGAAALYKDLTSSEISLIDQASIAKLLTTGYLGANEEITYALRTWIDIDTTTETPNVMGKTWNGKVVVISEATGSYEEKTITGTRAAYITDGKNMTIKNLEITGGTESGANVGQDGAMDIVVSGKNLFNYNWISSKTSNTGIVETNNNNGCFTFAGTYNNTSDDAGRKYLNHNQSLNIFFNSGNYSIKLFKDSVDTLNGERIIPYFFSTQTYDGGRNDYGLHTNNVAENSTSYNVTQELLSYSDFTSSMGFYILVNQTFTPGTYCPQLEYNSEPTEFEPYKERRYTIHLKDASNNTISGLSSTDTLKKVNGSWVIDNGTTQTTLSGDTQSELNSITLYDGISRVWVDDDVLVNGISATYLSSNRL